jgi:hypothetical protein
MSIYIFISNHNPPKKRCLNRILTLNVIFSVMVLMCTMVTFRMTLLMNKFTNTVMDDGCVHPLSATCDEILSWMIEILMKNHLVSDSNYNTVTL